MSTHAATLRGLRDAVRISGATLPEEVSTVLDSEPLMPAPVATVRREIAEEIAASTGTKDAARQVATALDLLARAEAADKVRSEVASALDRLRAYAVRDHADEILDAVRDALADDLETLTTYAPRVPLTIDPTMPNAASLPPSEYEAWFTTRPIDARLRDVVRGLAPLYGIHSGPTGRTMTAAATRHRVALLSLPEGPGPEDRHALVLGVMGKRLTESLRDDAPWFAAVARHGATFTLTTPEQYRENVERLAEWEREIQDRARAAIDGNPSGRFGRY